MEMYISKRASKLDCLKIEPVYFIHSPSALLSGMGAPTLARLSVAQDVLSCKSQKAEIKVALTRKWISLHIGKSQHRAALSWA